MNLKKCVYQFKITLMEIEPEIWRRILTPTHYTFWDLHVAIQDSMGWKDYHLHQFSIKRPGGRKVVEIGIPDDTGYSDTEIFPGWEVEISKFFDIGVSAIYNYDFGDDWNHEVFLEGLMHKEKGVRYPVCIDGRRRCPPEDCGGADGYFDFLEAVLNPAQPEHEEMIEWYGGPYNPDEFDPGAVKFDNPGKRLKKAFP